MTQSPQTPSSGGETFPAEHWTPRERPRDSEQVVHLTRRDDSPAPVSASVSGGASTFVRRSGPLIWTTDDGLTLVRFRHHASAARAVALQANGWWRPEPRDACDLRPAGDGWWEGIFEVPGDWRASYGFCEHHGEGQPPWWDSGLKRPGVRVVPDVTNPRAHRAARGGEARSVVSVPEDGPFSFGVGDDNHDDKDEPTPTLRMLETGDTEPITRWWASGPGDPECEDLDPRQRLPLLIVTDGRQHADQLATPRLLRRGVTAGLLPPLAALFVEAGEQRGASLGVPGGHAQWIAEQLVPRLHVQGLGGGRRLDHDPARTVITGSSFGGLTALFAVARAPELIGSAIAQSVSLWRYREGALSEPVVRACSGLPVRLRLHAGRFEGTMAPAARALVDSLTAGGIDASLTVHSGGHDWAWWQPAMLRELGALLRSGDA